MARKKVEEIEKIKPEKPVVVIDPEKIEKIEPDMAVVAFTEETKEAEEKELTELFPESRPDGKKKLKFRKIGGGSLRGLPGYPIIKPGQVFDAYVDDIPVRFLNSLQCLDPGALTEALNNTEKLAPKEISWKPVQTKPGKWDVIGLNEKAINETSMTEVEAIKLAEALNN